VAGLQLCVTVTGLSEDAEKALRRTEKQALASAFAETVLSHVKDYFVSGESVVCIDDELAKSVLYYLSSLEPEEREKALCMCPSCGKRQCVCNGHQLVTDTKL